MATFVTWQETTSNGSQTNYNIIFPFLARTHVIVKFNGAIQATTAYTFTSDSVLKLVTAAANLVVVRVQRITPQTIQTDFQGSALLPEADLDDGYLQMLYHIQELQDLYDEAVDAAIAVASLSTPAVTNNLTATTSPGVTDDGDSDYDVGSMWWDATNKKIYFCSDITVGAAVWTEK